MTSVFNIDVTYTFTVKWITYTWTCLLQVLVLQESKCVAVLEHGCNVRCTHWCRVHPADQHRHGNSRCGTHRWWRPQLWSGCWEGTVDTDLDPGLTWRYPGGMLREQKNNVTKWVKKKKKNPRAKYHVWARHLGLIYQLKWWAEMKTDWDKKSPSWPEIVPHTTSITPQIFVFTLLFLCGLNKWDISCSFVSW